MAISIDYGMIETLAQHPPSSDLFGVHVVSGSAHLLKVSSDPITLQLQKEKPTQNRTELLNRARETRVLNSVPHVNPLPSGEWNAIACRRDVPRRCDRPQDYESDAPQARHCARRPTERIADEAAAHRLSWCRSQNGLRSDGICRRPSREACGTWHGRRIRGMVPRASREWV
jgi:hypothetical protein